jgi:cellulose synthase/poly-beta-1,6-N-acetylglucosamine synthase-like glycosyltransferase
MYTIFYALNLTMAFTIVCYSIFVFIHIISWQNLSEQKINSNVTFNTRVTIIIPTRNEEKNISSCIKSILTQSYPHNLIELFICDDHSEDSTKQVVLENLRNAGLNYQLLDVAPSSYGKKRAIEEGIKASSGELIVITDADCTAEKGWISAIVSAYVQTKANMLCGPVSLLNEKNLCEKFQGLEFCGLSMLSGAGIKLGMPLLSNAANIAYTRRAFDAVEGFKGIDGTPSGDDILLMFKINKTFPGAVHYIKNESAMVYTKGQPSWKGFFNQRIRWASKGLHSKNTSNYIISLLVLLSNLLPVICLIGSFSYPSLLKVVLYSLTLKVVIDFLLLYFATDFFKKRKFLLYFPIAIVIVMIYTSVVGIMGNFISYNWKGRNY